MIIRVTLKKKALRYPTRFSTNQSAWKIRLSRHQRKSPSGRSCTVLDWQSGTRSEPPKVKVDLWVFAHTRGRSRSHADSRARSSEYDQSNLPETLPRYFEFRKTIPKNKSRFKLTPAYGQTDGPREFFQFDFRCTLSDRFASPVQDLSGSRENDGRV